MSPALLFCLFACAGGLSLTLVADATGRKRLEWIGKPLAALAFIGAGLLWGALESIYGQLILAGLVFGALGDVLLIPAGTGRVFLGGMVAFALGHVLYVVAFGSLPLSVPALYAAAIAMVVFSAVVLRWLMPHVPDDFKVPVLLYITIIAFMVVAAIGATVAGATPWIAIGALGFALSDLAVARHRFVAPGTINRLWGLPLYFASQVVIASTVAVVAVG